MVFAVGRLASPLLVLFCLPIRWGFGGVLSILWLRWCPSESNLCVSLRPSPAHSKPPTSEWVRPGPQDAGGELENDSGKLGSNEIHAITSTVDLACTCHLKKPQRQWRCHDMVGIGAWHCMHWTKRDKYLEAVFHYISYVHVCNVL